MHQVGNVKVCFLEKNLQTGLWEAWRNPDTYRVSLVIALANTDAFFENRINIHEIVESSQINKGMELGDSIWGISFLGDVCTEMKENDWLQCEQWRGEYWVVYSI